MTTREREAIEDAHLIHAGLIPWRVRRVRADYRSRFETADLYQKWDEGVEFEPVNPKVNGAFLDMAVGPGAGCFACKARKGEPCTCTPKNCRTCYPHGPFSEEVYA